MFTASANEFCGNVRYGARRTWDMIMRAYVMQVKRPRGRKGTRETVGNEGSRPRQKSSREIDESVSERVEARGEEKRDARRIRFSVCFASKKRKSPSRKTSDGVIKRASNYVRLAFGRYLDFRPRVGEFGIFD